jgi:cytochrome oxidase Cu insertion factor (SCO1/SenC/PrrC family)
MGGAPPKLRRAQALLEALNAVAMFRDRLATLFSHAFVRCGLAAAVASIALGCGLVATGLSQELRPAPDRVLSFVDADGRVVRSSDFPEQWLLIYFGYMHCSDLCPTGLSVLANALEQIGPAAAHLQPLFVTVDPERDHGAELRRFAQAFDKRLIGLTGSVAEIKRAAAALGVSFEKVVQPGQSYVVDHSADYLLLDPSRRTVRTLRFAEAHLLAAKLIELLAAAGTPLGNVNNIRAYR